MSLLRHASLGTSLKLELVRQNISQHPNTTQKRRTEDDKQMDGKDKIYLGVDVVWSFRSGKEHAEFKHDLCQEMNQGLQKLEIPARFKSGS